MHDWQTMTVQLAVEKAPPLKKKTLRVENIESRFCLNCAGDNAE